MALFSLYTEVVRFVCRGVDCATFTLVNQCDFTVWPGIPGSSKLDSTGFELPKGDSRSFPAPAGWSGRFWGRTGCNFDDQGHGSCLVGDCGSGQAECNGAGSSRVHHRLRNITRLLRRQHGRLLQSSRDRSSTRQAAPPLVARRM